MGISPSDYLAMKARLEKPMASQSAGEPVDREGKLHEDIIKFCGDQWPRWKIIHARMDKRSTIAVGAQDFTIFRPGGVLLVECKKKGGKLDPDQQIWRKEMEMIGHTVHIVWSMNDFEKLL